MRGWRRNLISEEEMCSIVSVHKVLEETSNQLLQHRSYIVYLVLHLKFLSWVKLSELTVNFHI